MSECSDSFRGGVYSVAISTDNRFIVSAGDDGTVRRWDMKTGQAIGSPLQGHSGWVNSVAISTDNRFIVSAGNDGTVRRWDIKTQKYLAIQHSLSGGSFFCTDGNHKATHWNLDDWDRLYAEGRDENGETVRLSPSDYPDYANNQRPL
ncbi:High-affnity carbon uptake protein Hat/HatR [hydrothermal vent metagenome]|uniref:High-affnity carbon uptake protein Hat/HatR n=1 Tax=hydrothermal vent metagenome TaxID=652676 RepID=A0A1W1E228_9ZZZZ